MINWILQNKEWLFSGIGITVFTIIIWFIKTFLSSKKKNYKCSDKEINIYGDKSTYIENNGGDIHIK